MKPIFLVLTHFPMTENLYKLRLNRSKAGIVRILLINDMSPNAIHLNSHFKMINLCGNPSTLGSPSPCSLGQVMVAPILNLIQINCPKF